MLQLSRFMLQFNLAEEIKNSWKLLIKLTKKSFQNDTATLLLNVSALHVGKEYQWLPCYLQD